METLQDIAKCYFKLIAHLIATELASRWFFPTKMQYSIAILSLLISSALGLPDAVAAGGSDLPNWLSVRDQDLQAHHHLSKRQSLQCPFFFLEEPPRSIQCVLPQRLLPLNCSFLVGQIRNRVVVDVSWFFSLDGILGRLVQTARFETIAPFVAFMNTLVVRMIRVLSYLL